MIGKVQIEGFKGFRSRKEIELSKLNLLFGGNSTGKSSMIQTLLLLKQTIESGGRRGDIKNDLLLNGSYVNLGEWNEIINRRGKDSSEKVVFALELHDSENDSNPETSVEWQFKFDSENEIGNINGIFIANYEYKTTEQNNCFSYNSKVHRLEHDNKESIISSLKVSHLMPNVVNFKVDRGLNTLLHNYLDEIFELVVLNHGVTKIKKWNKQLAFLSEIDLINQSISRLLTQLDVNGISLKDMIENTSNEVLSKNAMKLYQMMIDDLMYGNALQDKSMILVLIMIAQSSDGLKSIVEKYQKIYEQYSKDAEDYIEQSYSTEIQDKQIRLEQLGEVIRVNNTIRATLENMYYLGPIRERPKPVYQYAASSDPKYVGINGEYIAFILAYFKDEIISKRLLPNGEDDCTLIEAINLWLDYLDVAQMVTAEINSGMTISVKDNGVKSSINNVGVGVSQVLPVITLGLLSVEQDILLFEQPELHLHPYAQSKLMDFFAKLANNNRQIIVETHSEYFLQRLRYLLLDEQIDETYTKTIFFSKNIKGNIINYGSIKNDGSINYPQNYKDTTENLISDILLKKAERMMQN